MDYPDYAVEKVTFEMADLTLEPGKFRAKPLPTNFAKRVAAIVEAAGKMCHTIKPSLLTNYPSRDAQEESGDSGEEAPRDDRVTSPFTAEESVCINVVLHLVS